jgi:hypothetical protein
MYHTSQNTTAYCTKMQIMLPKVLNIANVIKRFPSLTDEEANLIVVCKSNIFFAIRGACPCGTTQASSCFNRK